MILVGCTHGLARSVIDYGSGEMSLVEWAFDLTKWMGGRMTLVEGLRSLPSIPGSDKVRNWEISLSFWWLIGQPLSLWRPRSVVLMLVKIITSTVHKFQEIFFKIFFFSLYIKERELQNFSLTHMRVQGWYWNILLLSFSGIFLCWWMSHAPLLQEASIRWSSEQRW